MTFMGVCTDPSRMAQFRGARTTLLGGADSYAWSPGSPSSFALTSTNSTSAAMRSVTSAAPPAGAHSRKYQSSAG